MEDALKQKLAESLRGFHLPRYRELPDMGLYLEQTVQYINACLEPLGCVEITGSMVRNYVKQGLVENPVRKRYHADQIGYLICITLLKQAAPLEYVHRMFRRQRDVYANQMAYDYFCCELENVLFVRFGLKEQLEDLGVTSTVEKELLRSGITAVSHMIYMNACFRTLYPDVPR